MYSLLVITFIHTCFANELLYTEKNDLFPSNPFFQRNLRLILGALTIITMLYQFQVAGCFLSVLLLSNKSYNLHNNQDLKTKSQLTAWFRMHISPISFKNYIITKVNYLRKNRIRDSQGYEYGKAHAPLKDLEYFEKKLKTSLSREYRTSKLEEMPDIPIKHNSELKDLKALPRFNISKEQMQTTFVSVFRALKQTEPVVPPSVLTQACMKSKHL